jgi:hypothetical protein
VSTARWCFLLVLAAISREEPGSRWWPADPPCPGASCPPDGPAATGAQVVLPVARQPASPSVHARSRPPAPNHAIYQANGPLTSRSTSILQPEIVACLVRERAGVGSRRAGQYRAGHPCPRSQPQLLDLREEEVLALPAPWPLPRLGRSCSLCLAATRCLAGKPPQQRAGPYEGAGCGACDLVSQRQRCRAQHRSDRRLLPRRASERHVGPATSPERARSDVAHPPGARTRPR